MIRNLQLITLSSLCLLALLAATSQAQITPSQDAFTNSADPTTNFGANGLLDVDGASQITYIQFNLASIPAGAKVSQATLKLYVNAVTTAGSFNVDNVNGAWSESTITHNLSPALGGSIVSGVPITTADANQFILINVTPAVEAWLDGSQANDGIALVADSTFNASFDSKENTTTSHPAELDLVFASSGGGTITGVTTAGGSGLTGGGTTGALSLSLLKTCANGQVLEWSGTAWACATAAGTGTITGVAAGTDLTGGGTSGKVTLNLDTTKVPLLVAGNTFTGNQAVIGTLTSTVSMGVGTVAPATSLDIFSSTVGGEAPIARFGSNGASDSNSILAYNGTGITETFQAGCDGCFIPQAQAGDGGIRVSPGTKILLGDQNGSRLTLDSAGNALQPLTAGGMAKAMVFVNPEEAGIVNCFNSTLSGAAATTAPCGFTFTRVSEGSYTIDFGFKVDDRFLSATQANSILTIGVCTDTVAFGCPLPGATPNKVEISISNITDDGAADDSTFWLLVY
jgi:hypothetical protein